MVRSYPSSDKSPAIRSDPYLNNALGQRMAWIFLLYLISGLMFRNFKVNLIK